MLTLIQKKQRLRRMTSSVIAAALGRDKFKTPIGAWEEIIGAGDFTGNRATDRGDELEDLTLRKGIAMAGAADMIRPAFVTHPDDPWAGDSCDALYVDAWGQPLACAEAKTVALGGLDEYGEEGTDVMPDKVFMQAIWHLKHHDLPVCHVPILVGGYAFEFRHYLVERNAEYIGLLTQAAERWYRDYVVPMKRPPVTGSDKDTEWLLKRWRRAGETMLERTPEIDALVGDVLLAKANLKAASIAEALACNNLRLVLEDHCGIVSDEYAVSYRENKDTLVTNWEAIARQLNPSEDLILEFTKSRDGARVLRVSPIKAKPTPKEKRLPKTSAAKKGKK